MKTVLVTGASGYIGTQVVRALVEENVKVIALDRNASLSTDDAEVVCGDIFDEQLDVCQLIGYVPDVCLHLAWRNGFAHNEQSHMLDLSSHYRFLTNLANQGVKHIAVMGTMHEIGYWEGVITAETPCKPLSLYGVAKNALRESLELTFAQSDVLFQWLRAFYIYGNDSKAQSIFGKILRASESGEKEFPFTTGKNKYDFITVEELSQQIAAVILQDDVSGIINCCSGKPESLAHRVESFIKDNSLDISLNYGAFPDRPYDSPGIWGDARIVKTILANTHQE